VTKPPDEPHPKQIEPPRETGSLVGPWGTAHLTAAVLLVLALVWCGLRPPGRTYDFRPLPVPTIAWAVWASGLAYLASSAAAHFRLGAALRRGSVPNLGTLLTGGLSSVLLIVVAGRSVLLQAASRTHAAGLENLTATLGTAAGLSLLLFVVTSLQRRGRGSAENRVSVAVTVGLVIHWVLAVATVGALLYLEQLSPAAG
jgi:hypothetical protein